jgi:sortase (surface protein transpeptidase)
VERTWVTVPTDVAVVANTPDQARLTLTTCHPKGSARQRLILSATMVSAEAFDA